MNADQAAELRRPLPASAVGFRIDAKQAQNGAYRCVVYIDARVAGERLTAADPGWSEDYTVLPSSGKVQMRCDLTVAGTTRTGFGEGRDLKSAESDALKRAAVKFGVGAYLYALPPFRVSQSGVWTKRNGEAGGLKKEGVVELRKQHDRWVNHAEFQKFGKVVDYATVDDGGERHADDEHQDEPTRTRKAASRPEAAAQRAQKLEGLAGV